MHASMLFASALLAVSILAGPMPAQDATSEKATNLLAFTTSKASSAAHCKYYPDFYACVDDLCTNLDDGSDQFYYAGW